MPHFLARLPLTALATSLASCALVPGANAAEGGQIDYVFAGFDETDRPTAPGLASARVDAAQSAPARPPATVLAVLAPAALAPAAIAPGALAVSIPTLDISAPELAPPQVVLGAAPITAPESALAVTTPLPTGLATSSVLPQGPMPDGTALAALVALRMPALETSAPVEPEPEPEAAEADKPGLDDHGELLPVDPVQQPVQSSTAAALAVAPKLRAKPAVLSLLDGPGPLPALRPVSSMVSGPKASEAAAAGGGDPPGGDIAPDAEAEPAPMPPSGKAEETESLTDAIIASLKGNPEIQIALAQQDDAKYGVIEARAGYLPHVDVTAAWGREFARNVPQTATQRYRSEATISLNQNLWDFGVTINDIKRARANYRSAQWGTREKIEAISYDITNAYLGVLLQQKLVELAEGEIASIKKIVRIVTVQKDLGLTTPADVERAQTRLENVRSVLLDRTSALQQARNAYKRLTNRLPLRAADVPAAGQALPESADAAVDMIDTRSPRLAQAVEDRRSLDKQYDSQADTTLPRFGLTIASDYKRDVLGATGRAVDARAMVTMSYQLYNGGATTAIKRRIGARLRQADYELDRRRREVEQDIRIDYAGLGAAKEKIATIEDEITSAQRVADLYKQQFRGGRRTVFDLLDSEQQLFAARAKQVANQLALRAAEYRVLQKLGGLFDLVSGGQPLLPLVVPAPGSDE